MGNWSTDCLAIISDVIGPGPTAVREQSSFDPDQGWQERQVERIWAQRGRLVEYLGDWHTHPHGSPRPSRENLATARLIASAPVARAERPVMLVVGISSDGTVKPHAGVFSGRQLKRTQLRIDGTFDDAELDRRLSDTMGETATGFFASRDVPLLSVPSHRHAIGTR